MENLDDIKITEKDVKYLAKVISDVGEPVEIGFLAAKLRERIIRSRKINFAERLIKVYDPTCNYEIGDHIFRYFGKVRTSQRKNEEFNDYAEGEVYDKILQPDQEFDLICVSWQHPLVKKQAAFLRKSGAQQYLPVNFGRPKNAPVRFLGPDKTERTKTDVIEQHRARLLRVIRKKLTEELYRHEEFLTWGSLWYLIDLLEEIDYELIVQAERLLEEADGPVNTQQLVKQLFGLDPDAPRFLHYRFSLNYMMENFFAEKFYCLSHFAGGAWTTRAKVPKDFGCRPLRLATAKIPEALRRKEFALPEDRLEDQLKRIYTETVRAEAGRVTSDRVSHVLTYNEYVCGSIALPPQAGDFFPEDTRIVFVTPEGVEYPVTYHYESGFIEGLTSYIREAGLVPGAIVELTKTQTPTRFEIDYRRSEQRLRYPVLEYDPERDHVRVVPGSEREVDCFTDSHAFVPAGDIRIIEDLRNSMRVDVGLYDVLVRLFRNYRSSFHPLTLWRMANVIRQAPLICVLSVLTAYKSFYRLDDDGSEEYHLSPTQLGIGNLKRGIRETDRRLIQTRLEEDDRARFFRPKTFVVNFDESRWEIAREYAILPISHGSENVEIRRFDNLIVLADGVVHAAARVAGPREVLDPRIAEKLGDGDFVADVPLLLLGEGPCEDVEVIHLSETGELVEMDEETFERLLDYYSTTQRGAAV